MNEIILENDSLGRGNYARSLYRIIGDYSFDNNGKIKKPLTNSDNEAFVIAVSSPWGTGKTHFVKIFKEVLVRNPDVFKDGIDLFDEKMSIEKDNIILYDAWNNDFWDNAFEPLFDTITKCTSSLIEHEPDAADALTKAGNTLIRFFKAFGALSDLSKFIAEFLTAIRDANGDFYNLVNGDSVKDYFPDYSKYKGAQKELKDKLTNVVKKTGKIVIIIDELDRCKPTFAVQTLEIIRAY